LQPADLDAIAARIVDAAARGEEPSPAAAILLLRRYTASPGDDLGDALGVVLAQALDAAAAASAARERAAWLMLFVEAAPLADDERVPRCARALCDRLRAAWPADLADADSFAASAASVDACLCASTVCDPASIVQIAVDELERIVGAAYRPGQGLVVAGAAADRAARDARADAHVACASALLTAYGVTARLPYSMLAEELMQTPRRAPSGRVDVDCAAARVLCRLAALHDDADYRRAAVIAPDADYRADAARLLRSQQAHARAGRLTDAASFGIALEEFLAVRRATIESPPL
jgi:hypothetical protein